MFSPNGPDGICASPSCARPFVNTGRGPAPPVLLGCRATRERVAAYREAGRARLSR